MKEIQKTRWVQLSTSNTLKLPHIHTKFGDRGSLTPDMPQATPTKSCSESSSALFLKNF
jgi:hypothetical protein